MQLPNGSTISIASTLAAPVTITGISNANPAVVTAAAHGLSDGDIVIVYSGWELLNGRVARVDNSTTGTFELEGIDTSATADYPAGSGGGTAVEVSAWTEITDILNPTSSGGEQQFWTYQTLKQRRQKQLPTVVTPVVITMQPADTTTAPWYDVVNDAAKGGEIVPMRVQLPSGGLIYYNGYWGHAETPSLTVNEGMLQTVTFSVDADITRYAA